MPILSVPEREAFLCEPRIAALSVNAGPGRAPFTVPIWYDYAPRGEAWIITEAASRKARLIKDAGRFSLMVQRIMPTDRYVSVEGPVSRVVPATDQQVRAMTERYLPAERVEAYLKLTETFGEQIAIYLRPQRWLTGDMGPGALPPGGPTSP